MNGRTQIVLAFSRQDLRAVGEGAYVLPLRPDLHVTAQALFGAERVIDAADLLPSRVVNICYARSMRQILALRSAVFGNPRKPWLDSVGFYVISVTLGFLAFFERLLRELERRYDSVMVPAGFDEGDEWKPNTRYCVLSALHCAAGDAYDRGGDIVFYGKGDIRRCRNAFKRGSRRLLYAGKSALGGWFNRACAGQDWLVKHRGRLDPACVEPADVVLAGVQRTDAVLQTELAVRLERKYGNRFVWLCGETDADLESGEKALWKKAETVSRRIVSRDVFRPVWRLWPVKALAYMNCAWDTAGILRAVPRHGCGASRVRLTEMLMQIIQSEAALESRKWYRLLDHLDCKVLVSNSDLFEMACVESWARRRNKPHVRMTHGVSYDDPHFLLDCGGTHGVLHGPYWARRFLQLKGGRGRAAIVGGPLYLQDETVHARGEDSPGSSDQVLFLETSDPATPGLFSARQTMDWFDALGRAAGKAGANLLLRGHPRAATGPFYDMVARRIRDAGSRCEADNKASIAVQLRQSRCVVARLFENACAKTVMMGVPLIAFMPCRGWISMDRMMARVALVTRTEEDLASCLHRMMHDEEFRQGVIRDQLARLQEFVDTSCVDGWDKVVDFVDQVLKEAPKTS